MQDSKELLLNVISANEAVTTRAVDELRRALTELGEPNLQIQRAKDASSLTQDMGASLVLIFGAPAIVALSQGIADWLRRRHADASIELEIDGRKVLLRGDAVAGVDVADIITRVIDR